MADSAATTPAEDEGGSACPNCGHPRRGRFCAACGQNDRDYIRSLPPVLGDMLKETFELDSRIVRTAKPLFFRPGELPSEFSRNRRASYVSPIRLYIFASIAFFFLLSVTADFGPARVEVDLAQERDELARFSEQAKDDAGLDELKALLPRAQRRKVDEILRRQGMLLSKSAVYSTSQWLAERDEPLAEWERYLVARFVDALADPRELYSLLIDNLPFALFVTLPAYAVLLMLFFAGSRRFFTEHLVFAVQLHTFAFIVFTVLVMLPDGDGEDKRARVVVAPEQAQTSPPEGDADDWDDSGRRVGQQDGANVDGQEGADAGEAEDDDGGTLTDWIRLLLMIWVLAYHYLALRRYYGNGRFATAIKWAMLSGAYAVLLIPGFLLSLTLAFIQL